MMRFQTVDARDEEALLPADDGRSGGPKPQLDGAEGCPFGQHQDESNAKNVSCRKRAGLRDATEFQLLVDVDRTSNVYSATGH
jgi:hypothetical protein